MKPTAERIRELLSYDPLTGVFIWKHRKDVEQRWNTRWADKVAGSPHYGGYIAIAIDHVKYLAHHLAWVYMTGTWPTSFVDHEDLNKKNNIWENLREASFAENSANISVRKTSSSGYRGVHFSTKNGKWAAKISKDKTEYHLGFFDDRKVAAIAYANKAKELYGDYCPKYLMEMVA